MEQYFSATQRMEREVMFPSLLRGVFAEPPEAGAGARTDLYERYQLLKAMKPVVQRGLGGGGGEQSAPGGGACPAPEHAEGAELEERLAHHLHGLQQVLSHLARDANALTRRYSQILEQINLGEGQPSW
ncbi:M1I1B protein, partial [Nothoprocta ornata]|nr:M1I1B protein [Nothoprocta ornata]